jgi:hypothetical protein
MVISIAMIFGPAGGRSAEEPSLLRLEITAPVCPWKPSGHPRFLLNSPSKRGTLPGAT